MIRIYDATTIEWDNNGLAVLTPSRCDVTEQANGLYDLDLEHPILDDMRWLYLQRGKIIKAPVPARETPALELRHEGVPGTPAVPGRVIWKVKSSVGYSRLYTRPNTGYSAWNAGYVYYRNEKVQHGGVSYVWNRATGGNATPPASPWKKIPSPTVVLTRANTNQEYEWLGAHDSNWHKAATADGQSGYMLTSRGELVRTETAIPATPSTPGSSTVIKPRQIREQLFRIYEVERDSQRLTVRVKARHVTYDLLGNLTRYECDKKNAQDALEEMSAEMVVEHDFSFMTNINKNVTGEWPLKNGIEVLLDPDEGMVQKLRAQLIRDNFDIFLLANKVTDRGVSVRYGKNLIGVKVHEDQDGVVTRVIPVGEDKDGHPLYLPELSVDSDLIYDYPTVYAKDLRVIDAKESDEMTKNQAYELMRAEAQAELDKGIDMPTLSMEVDFIQLGDTDEYKQFKDLQQVFLFDTVTIHEDRLGLSAKAQVNGYTWDCILGRYKHMSIGDIFEVGGGGIGAYQIPSSSISSTKIMPGGVGSVQLRDLAVTTAKIMNAAITSAKIGVAEIKNAHIGDAEISTAKIKDLEADVIRAVTAEIEKVTAEEIATNELYAELIHAIVFEVGKVTARDIETNALYAEIIKAVMLEVEKVTSEEVETTELYAELINAVTMEIGKIKAENIETSELYAVLANVVHLASETLDVDFARIKDLVTDTALITQGVGGEFYIAKLHVTEANMVSLTVGELILRTDDGRFVRIGIGKDDEVDVSEVRVEGENIGDDTIPGGKLIENSITARELAVEMLFADEAVMSELIAGIGQFGELFALSAVMPYIQTNIIESEALKIEVSNTVSEDIEDLRDDVETFKTAVGIGPSGVKIRQSGQSHGIDLGDGAVDIVDEDGLMVARMSGGQSYFPVMEADKITISKFVTTILADGGTVERWVD